MANQTLEEQETMIMIRCGSIEGMELIAKRGVKGLNRKTHKWQVVDKDAKYEVRNQHYYTNDEGEAYDTAELFVDRDLKAIAKEKDLILP